MALGGPPYHNPYFINMGQVPSYGHAYGMAVIPQRSTNTGVTGAGTEPETYISSNHSEIRANTVGEGPSNNFSTNGSDSQTENSNSQKQDSLENTQPIMVNSPGDSKLRNESTDKINETSVIFSDQINERSANKERVCNNTQNEFAQSLVSTAVPSATLGFSVVNENALYSNPVTSLPPSMNLMNWYNFPSYGARYDYSSIPTPISPDCGMFPGYSTIMSTTPSDDCSPLPSSAIDLQQNVPWFGGLQSSQAQHNCATDGGPIGQSTWMTTGYPSPEGDRIPDCFAPQLPVDATIHGYKNMDTFHTQTTKTEHAAWDSALKPLPKSEDTLSKSMDVTNADQHRPSDNGLVSI